MSESETVGVSPECGCVNCRIGRQIKALEKERDEVLALAFQRGRSLAAAIQERDDARKIAEAERRRAEHFIGHLRANDEAREKAEHANAGLLATNRRQKEQLDKVRERRNELEKENEALKADLAGAQKEIQALLEMQPNPFIEPAPFIGRSAPAAKRPTVTVIGTGDTAFVAFEAKSVAIDF